MRWTRGFRRLWGNLTGSRFDRYCRLKEVRRFRTLEHLLEECHKEIAELPPGEERDRWIALRTEILDTKVQYTVVKEWLG